MPFLLSGMPMTKIRFFFLLLFCGLIAALAGYFVFLNSSAVNLHLFFFQVSNIRVGSALIIAALAGAVVGVMLAAAVISLLMMRLRLSRRKLAAMQIELDTYRLQGVKESS
ncbi:MAG TPA: lipopolysaccharide assembly protein LapA domain-containing protein [Pseudomonadales bacterium]|nr:lipopolysaccharide assembly protein LapA domain-containing protein [Pseudomonadales bacterium]